MLIELVTRCPRLPGTVPEFILLSPAEICPRRKNNAGTDKQEEKKLAGPLVKKELPAEECSRRYGKWEESSRQKKISDDRQHYDKWTV